LLLQLSSDYSAQLARCEAAEAESAALRRDCGAAQELSAALAAECDARSAALEAATQRLQEARAAQASSSQAWDSERASLQVRPCPHKFDFNIAITRPTCNVYYYHD
jgi:hypothetical protein